ncbi:hypothetical protein KR222_006161, partial [Zaprionus bogoriensis]
AELDQFSRVLNLTKYYYIQRDEKLNWFEALHRCRQNGSDLLHFSNEDEFKGLAKELRNYGRDRYWMGMSDLSGNGTFTSITTGRLPDFKRWHKIEPNNKGNDEHCVELVMHRRGWRLVAGMNDNQCLNSNYFICETKIPSQTNIVVW